MGNIQLWPGGIVPYMIGEGQPGIEHLLGAIEQWNRSGTPVRLVRRSAEADYVEFVSAGRCASKRGRTGGRQEITLTPSCRPGVILHEIGHAVGLMHEHNRPDRDKYLERIVLENIYPAVLSNFQTRPEHGEELLEYDFGSIMHYSQLAFSRNRGVTVVPRQELVPEGVLIGQRRELSQLDVQRLRSMYPDVGIEGNGPTTQGTGS
jgi:hypothetical protein